MSQCVPSWDLDDVTPSSRVPLRSRSNSSIAPDVPLLDYEVAELTWENGQIAMHGLGPPRVPTNNKHSVSNSGVCKYALSHWEKPRAGGTLESIVNQATRPSFPPPPTPPRKVPPGCSAGDELVPWFELNATSAAAATATATASVTANNMASASNNKNNMNMDAEVPCGGGTMGSYTQVASCSGAAATEEMPVAKRARNGVVGSVMGGAVPSVSGTSGTFETSHQVRLGSHGGERDFGGLDLPENDSSGKPSTKAATAADDHDSVCHSRLQRESGDEEEEEDDKKGKSSVSTKRSRAAAIHNQSERKRRDKINQRMKTLQKLVPNSSKTDKASMLDEVIDYLKQLQAQVQMMSRMNMPAMMLPMAVQQQLHLSMMSPMGMGMGMGMGMDINSIARPNLAGIPPVLHPNRFIPIPAWDGAADGRLQPQFAALMQDPSSFFACQSQPMTPEAYSRMAAMYQQLHQPPGSSSKS